MLVDADLPEGLLQNVNAWEGGGRGVRLERVADEEFVALVQDGRAGFRREPVRIAQCPHNQAAQNAP